MTPDGPRPAPAATPGLDVPAFLRAAAVPHARVAFATGARLFAQGARANSVFFVPKGP